MMVKLKKLFGQSDQHFLDYTFLLDLLLLTHRFSLVNKVATKKYIYF